MNFELEHITNTKSTYPPNYTITYIPELNSLLFYGHQKPVQQQPAPTKKSFAFKIDKAPPTTSEKIDLYNLHTNEWSTQEAKGKIPSSRTDHIVVYLDPCLILFGGKTFTTPNKILNDVYALNCSSWTWKKLFTLEGPSPSTNYHIGRINNNKLIVVGKDTWTLSLKDVKWELSANELPGAVWEKISVQIQGIPKGIAVKSQQEIFIFQRTGSFSILNLSNKTLNTSKLSKIDGNNLKVQSDKQPTENDRFYSKFNANQDLIILTNQLIRAYYYDRERMQMQIAEEKQMKGVNWISSDATQNSLYILSNNGEVYNIQTSEMKTARQVYKSQITQRNLLANSNSCIVEESHESSAFYSKDNDNEDSQQESINERNSRVLEQPPSSKSIEPNIQQNIMKDQLGTLLAHEHLKRKLLESKGRILQHAIKRSQKMVLTLCRYGDQRDKKKHIETVKSIRQDLEQTWNKQTYYRKQILNRKTNIPMKQLLSQNLDPTYSQFLS